MISILARNWWTFVGRGVLAVLFGLFALFAPGVTMLSLALLFAAYAIADGVLALISAVREARQGERWSLLALEGIAGILIGALAASFPGLTVIVFVAMVAAWALITGSFMLVAAFEVDAAHGRWWLALGGVASLVYGALLILAPALGALVLTSWIGAYAVIFGISMLMLAGRLRSHFKASPLGKLA
jgi:uncharacterized membrane protein HdeD (DUF308 family)